MQATSGRLGGYVEGCRRPAVAGDDKFEGHSMKVKLVYRHDLERKERQGFRAEAVGIRGETIRAKGPRNRGWARFRKVCGPSWISSP